MCVLVAGGGAESDGGVCAMGGVLWDVFSCGSGVW